MKEEKDQSAYLLLYKTMINILNDGKTQLTSHSEITK